MTYDLFISYRHADADRVLPLVEALRAAGLAIWIDEREIEDFAGITRSIVEGLANAKALLAWYSAIYPQSRACQWELTAAFLAAQRTGEVRRRLLLVNPEGDNGHIHPVELRDELYQQAPSPGDTGAFKKLAQTLKAHTDQLPGLLGDIQPLAAPPWYGKKGVGSNRFVGRLPDMWKLHTGLHAGDVAIITGSAAPGVAQVSGMGGVGKSLLAEEYALRFGAAFPGGVFWLRALGNDNAKTGLAPEEREAERTRQFSQMAARLGVPLQGLTPEEVEGRLAVKLGGEGKPFLWVIDDIPSGMAVENLQRWFAPHPLGKTLVTTRSREYRALGTTVPLGVLQPDEAWQLLTFHRSPKGAVEEDAAHGLLQDLGYHALAVEVAGSALKAENGLRSIAAYREALSHPTEDELELAATLADALPSGHEASIAGTFLRSIGMLGPEGEDFLRLASVLAVAPIPAGFVQTVFAAVDNLDENSALRRTRTALAQVDKLSLAEAADAGQGMRTVHTLISRTMRFRDHAAGRRELVQPAAARALLSEMPKAADIRSHAELAWAIPHARELSSQTEDVYSAYLMGWVARYELERGSYQAAKTGFRNEWELRKRIHGNEHPDTTVSAWSLYRTLEDLQEMDSAGEVLSKHLDWLLQSDPDRLAASQTQIRQMLMNMINQESKQKLHAGNAAVKRM